jgi:hypothetical protein
MDGGRRYAIARVDADGPMRSGASTCPHARGQAPVEPMTYGVLDIHAWMVARVTLMCQHLGDRATPVVAWCASRDEVRGIQVCVEVTMESVDAARAVGATLIVASRSVFGTGVDPSVAGLLTDVRWAATFARHGLSCIDAPALFTDPACGDVRASPVVVAAALSQAFPEVPVHACPGG